MSDIERGLGVIAEGVRYAEILLALPDGDLVAAIESTRVAGTEAKALSALTDLRDGLAVSLDLVTRASERFLAAGAQSQTDRYPISLVSDC